MPDAQFTLPLAGFILTVIGMSVAGARALSKMEARLTDRISQVESKNTEKLSQNESKIDDLISKQYHDFGESLTAIRTKITEVELYGRDNFVRREGFYAVQKQLTDDMKVLGEKLDTRLERMEDKLDSARKTQMGKD